MATLAEPIAMDFGSLALLGWLATGYLIGTAATQPLAGKLADIYSRRTGLLVSNLHFGTGNLVCMRDCPERLDNEYGKSMGGGRAHHNFDSPRIISRIRDLFWGFGSGLGGLNGGSLYSLGNWRLAFIAQLPCTLVSAVLMFIHVKKSKNTRAKSLIRRVTLPAVCYCLLPWKHPLILTSFLTSAVLFALFVYVEENFATEPVVPIRLMGNRTVTCVCLTYFLLTMTSYCFLYNVPIYVRLRGFSDKTAGAVLLPYTTTVAIGSLLTGIMISKTGKLKFLNMFLLITMLCASSFLYTCSLFTPLWMVPLYMALFGLCLGGSLTTTLLALVGDVQTNYEAVAISLSYAFRSIASVIGVAVASAAFQNVLYTSLWAEFGDREEASQIIDRITRNSDRGWLSWHDQQRTKSSFMQAVTAVFLAAVTFTFLGCVSGVLIKEPKGLNRKESEEPERV